MLITAPVTDYIPASLLSTAGDMVSRIGATVSRFPASDKGMVHMSQGVGANLTDHLLIGLLNKYYKGAGLTNYSAFGSLALRDTGIKIGNVARSTGGDQVITGVGFETSVIILLGADSDITCPNFSVGFDDGIIHNSFSVYTNGVNILRSTSISINIKKDTDNVIYGYVSAIGADGFTITWSLTGARTCNVIYLCLP